MTVYTTQQIYAAARKAGFNAVEAVTATAIALAESGGDGNATHRNSNGSTDYGVWQINSVHTELLRSGKWQDLNSNASMAYAVYKSSGFAAWSTFKSQHGQAPAYKAKLPGVQNTVNSESGGGVSQTWWFKFLFGSGSTVAGAIADNGGAAVDAVGNVASDATDATESVASAASSVTSFFQTLNSPEWWKRIGIGVLGGTLIVIALIIMLSSNPTVRKAAQTAALVVPK